LNLSEKLSVYLADRPYLSVAVTGDKYCIFGRVQGLEKINCCMWKICCSEPLKLALQNLEKFATEQQPVLIMASHPQLANIWRITTVCSQIAMLIENKKKEFVKD